MGHFIQVIIMMYMQKYSHTPIVLIGGGTGMVGDPSGRSDMRKLMTTETVQANCNAFKMLFEEIKDMTITVPSWVTVDVDKLEGKIISIPLRDEIDTPVAEHLIVELYSK